MLLQTKIQIAVLIGLAGLLSTALGCAYLNGRGAERAKAASEQAQVRIDAVDVNRKVSNAATDAASDFGDLQIRTRGEAANARREIETSVTPPAPGTVGRDALVSPDLALGVLCRVERLRGIAPRAGCPSGAADHGAGEPASAVPARPAA